MTKKKQVPVKRCDCRLSQENKRPTTDSTKHDLKHHCQSPLGICISTARYHLWHSQALVSVRRVEDPW